MVKFGRVELLSHPVCKAYLAMKWYGYFIIESLSIYILREWM